MKFKLNDQVKILLGKDRGRLGKLEKLFPKKQTAVVTGLNVFKKHLKAQGQKQPGGIIDITKPLAVSKLALICPHCHKQTRVSYQGQSRKKIRICCKCKKPIDST